MSSVVSLGSVSLGSVSLGSPVLLVVPSDVVYLAVGTPQGADGAADLTAMWAVVDGIGPHLVEGTGRVGELLIEPSCQTFMVFSFPGAA